MQIQQMPKASRQWQHHKHLLKALHSAWVTWQENEKVEEDLGELCTEAELASHEISRGCSQTERLC